MTKSLKSIKNKEEKDKTIARRIANNTKGLGYWAAIDARPKKDKQSEAK